MFFKKKGLPQLNDIVICTVVKVLPHAAFVKLEEHENLEAMLHISEVSSRWVRSIKEVINEGQKIVCKVINVTSNGQVDVSLKRVASGDRTRKLNEEKAEIRIEKLISNIASRNKKDPNATLKEVGTVLINEFGSLADFYNYVKENGVDVISELNLADQWKNELKNQIQEQLNAIKVTVQKEVEISSFSSEGIKDIKSFIKDASTFGDSNKMVIKFTYLSSPKYLLEITAPSYKDADIQLKKLYAHMCSETEKMNVTFVPGADK